MNRWKEPYSELYSKPSVVSEPAFSAKEILSVLHELDVLPTIFELEKAIDKLAPGKSLGSDEISPDLIKQCKTVLLKTIYEHLCSCLAEGEAPHDMRDTKIVTLYKKRDRSDCNYRGISLLRIVGKMYARIILARLHKLAKRIYPESQCGFRAERSSIDMIFSLRQLQEKAKAE